MQRLPTIVASAALVLACANPFAEPEPPVEADPVVVEPAPVAPEPDVPINDRLERFVSVASDASRVSYVHVPRQRLRSTPLVVVLHGGRENDPRLLARQVDHWFDRGVAFVFAGSKDKPTRSKRKNKGAPAEGKAGKGRDTDPDDLAWQELDDPEFVESLVTEVVAAKGIDPTRVYVVGQQSGAELVWTLACGSDRFAGYAMISGGLSRDQAAICPMDGMPARVAMFQATEDPWLLWSGDEHYLSVHDSLARLRKEIGCDDAPTEVERDDVDPDDGATVVQRDWSCGDGALRLYEIRGAGRAWPARSAGNRARAGTRDIDAMDELAELWGFPRR